MERRALLQAGLLGVAGSVAAACGTPAPNQNQSQNQGPPPSGASRPGAAPAQRGSSSTQKGSSSSTSQTGSLPGEFVKGGGQGLQLMFHGLCAFVLPKATDPLRVALLNGYPATPVHQHRAALFVPRGAVDLAKSTADFSAVDAHHVIYNLNGYDLTLDVAGLSKPKLKIKKVPVTQACADDKIDKAKWANAGWALDMGELYIGGTPIAWDKVKAISQARFEISHGTLEDDFDDNETPSGFDTNEWKINTTTRMLKQTLRLRIKDPGPISIVLASRDTGKTSSVVLTTDSGTVNAGVINLPAIMKNPTEDEGTRLDDVLAYYQMFDPSPLGKGNDATLPVPLWTKNPDGCSSEQSPECMCCPPSFCA